MTLKILLVDDDKDYLEFTTRMLSSVGYSVTIATEPMAALDAVARFRPDVCLLDVDLPGMDGYDLATKMRGWMPALTIILVSGLSLEADREIESGAVIDQFIGKPFTYEHLDSILLRLSQQHGMYQARNGGASTAATN
jgi:CheY-like chemotaxis protein